MDNNAAKIVSSAILCIDYKVVIINGKVYTLYPPTIHKIAGAGLYLSEINVGNSIQEAFFSLKDIGNLSHALSWLICDSDELYEEISQGTFEEVVEAISEAISMVSAENFLKLSTLVRNVQKLIANQKQ